MNSIIATNFRSLEHFRQTLAAIECGVLFSKFETFQANVSCNRVQGLINCNVKFKSVTFSCQKKTLHTGHTLCYQLRTVTTYVGTSLFSPIYGALQFETRSSFKFCCFMKYCMYSMCDDVCRLTLRLHINCALSSLQDCMAIKHIILFVCGNTT